MRCDPNPVEAVPLAPRNHDTVPRSPTFHPSARAPEESPAPSKGHRTTATFTP